MSTGEIHNMKENMPAQGKIYERKAVADAWKGDAAAAKSMKKSQECTGLQGRKGRMHADTVAVLHKLVK